MKALAFAFSLAISAPALAETPKPPKVKKSVLRHTNRKTWSGQAWQNLKWGMGPGDVVDALSLRMTDIEGKILGFETVYSKPIFDNEVRLYFMFKGNAPSLYTVNMMLNREIDALPDDFELRQCEAWSERVFEGLKGRYGTPECSSTETGDRHCVFIKKNLGLLVKYFGSINSCSTIISYRDLREQQKEVEKL